MMLQHSKLLLTLITCFSFVLASFANNEDPKGFEIKVKLSNYENKIAVLGYHYGDKQYVKDTVEINSEGLFVFKADSLLECGVYLVILPPENNYFQLLIKENDQNFSISTDAKDPYKSAKVKGSDENELFYSYMEFIAKMRTKADPLRIERDSTAKTDADKEKIQKKLDAIDAEVKEYQAKLLKIHENTLTAAIIKSSIEPEIPKYEGEKKDVDLKRYLYFRAHFFDNVSLKDPCMLRSPVQFQKINYYVEKLTPQHPDSIIVAVDSIISWVKESPDNYKYYLIHFLNVYAKSNIVGMDAVYVHIAKKYYCTGKAPWVEADQLKKICDNAATLSPLLIGKVAPNIRTQLRDSTFTTLHDVKADYTVLYIWNFDCGHCKKSMPDLVKFYNKYKDKKVQVYAIGSILPDEVDKNWKFVDEHDMNNGWINTIDPYNMSRYRTVFDVKTTPQVYVLDKDKKIVSKRVGAEQLDGIIDQLIQMDQRKLEEELKKGK